jgi:hypothetical protein
MIKINRLQSILIAIVFVLTMLLGPATTVNAADLQQSTENLKLINDLLVPLPSHSFSAESKIVYYPFKSCPQCESALFSNKISFNAQVASNSQGGGIAPNQMDPGEGGIPPTYFGNGSWVSWDGTYWMLTVFISHEDEETLDNGHIWAGSVCTIVAGILGGLTGDPTVAYVFEAVCNLVTGLTLNYIEDIDEEGAPGFLMSGTPSGVYIYP